MAYFTNEKDRKVKVYNNGVAVSSSGAQSEYARYLNFKENFNIIENTLSNDKVYDIVGLGYAIPQEGGIVQGTVNRPLNFNDAQFDIAEVVGSPGSYDISSTGRIIPYEAGTPKSATLGFLNFNGDHFDVSVLASDQYTVTSQGRVKVNDIATIRKLRITNTTNHAAVTVTDDAVNDEIDLLFRNDNDEVDVFSNGTLITTTSPRRLNMSTDFTVIDDDVNKRVDIALADSGGGGGDDGSVTPPPYVKRTGSLVWMSDPHTPIITSPLHSEMSGMNFMGSGDGLLKNMRRDRTGTASYLPRNDSDGSYIEFATDGSDNNKAGLLTNGNFARREASPHLYGMIKTPGDTTRRIFVGFAALSGTNILPDDTNDILSGMSGFGIFFADGGSQWQIISNDSSGSSVTTNTGVTGVANVAIKYHIWFDASVNDIKWSVNGGSSSSITASGSVPSSSTPMSFAMRLQAEAASVRTLHSYYQYVECDF